MVHSSDKNGISYIETKNLDGETNLKRKAAPRELQTKLDYETFPIKFEYEAPNPYLYSFTGTVHFEDYTNNNQLKIEKIPVDVNNFVLRGSSIRNTDFIIGMVAYTGHDTKIMLNSV